MSDNIQHQDKNSPSKNLGQIKEDIPKFKEDYQASKEETQAFLQRILD